MPELPEKLRDNYSLLTEQEKELTAKLLQLGQHHVFAQWDPPGTQDDAKHRLLTQLSALDSNCVGGLEGYLSRARKLLAAARAGENPFDGWTPSVPSGVKLEPFTPEYQRYEEAGIPELGKCGFVLVAGGLGERLGYNGIKIELPVETVTRTSYIQHYIEEILAIQKRYAVPGFKLPLAIMVSDDTQAKTIALLEKNAYFGMDPAQVTIMKQGKVPALLSNQAHMAMTSPYDMDSKPHGHGDVHSLMHLTGTAKDWQEKGVQWVIFFQDTNGLSFTPLPAMLGVSVTMELDVNSMAVPRFAKQAVGAITRLVQNSTGKEMTINVEYNQLDPLLRATVNPDGDVNDAVTGHSPYPGNINQLLFKLAPYVSVLEETQGVMPEFVNPKYKDSTRTLFKKPTRLECMMQDYPQLMMHHHDQRVGTGRVGFTMAPDWFCYSPCKNNATDAAASIASGVPAASPYTAECDQYGLWAKLLRLLGANLPDADPLTIEGITAVPSPRIVVKPSFAIFPHELRAKIRRLEAANATDTTENKAPATYIYGDASQIHISAGSSLLLDGEHIVLEKLALNGYLAVRNVDGPHVVVVHTADASPVTNRGHRIMYLSGATSAQAIAEQDRMRGYLLSVEECKEVSLPVSSSDAKSTCYVFNGQTLLPAGAIDVDEAEEDASGPRDWLSCLTMPFKKRRLF
eukprot:gene11484-8171_t